MHIHTRLIRRLLNLLLLLSVVGVVLTGVLVERFDLNEFRLHPLSGYAMTLLVTIHVVLHRRALFSIGGVRRRGSVDATGVSREHSAPEDELSPKAAGVAERPASLPSGGSRRAVIASLVAGTAGSALGWITRSQVAPNPYNGGDVGLFYHRESSMGVRSLASSLLDWGGQPSRYKDPSTERAVSLPAVAAFPVMSVAQAMQERRSRREFADRAMTVDELAWMVNAATGITTDGGRRTAPSAGALYPIETYVVINRVEGIEPGVYHVDVRAQALRPVRSGSVAGDVMFAGLGQDFLRTASAVFVLSAYFQRTRWKYHARHYRYVCWEAGHIAQNLYLAGEAAGLGVCVVGAFFDGTLNDLLRVDGREEAALGVVAVGPR